LTVHVQPGAARAEWVGEHGEALKVRLTARAVEGAANAALLEFVAKSLGLPRQGVRILRGEKSRHKVLALAMPVETVERKMAEIRVEQTSTWRKRV
jgi:hypothetical protein